MEHYFTARDADGIEPELFETHIDGNKYNFYSASGVFSKNKFDFGSRLLLKAADEYLSSAFFNEDEPVRVLDLGCGIGILGIMLALRHKNVLCTLTDINERAVHLAKMNVRHFKLQDRLEVVSGDKYENVVGKFDLIITNPPIRTGKPNVSLMLGGAAAYLNQGGALLAVIQKKQGSASYAKIIEAAFGNCLTIMRDKGYHILCSKL